MLSTATPKWLLAAGFVGLVAAPASAQSALRADLQPPSPSDFEDVALRAADVTGTSFYAPSGIKPQRRGGLVQDPSFEATPAQFGDNPFWEESASSFLPGTVFANNGTFGVELARTGNYFAIMGAGSVATEFVEQTVTVDEAGTYDLTFYFGGGNDRNDDGDDDDGLQGTLRAYVGGEVVYELSAQDAPNYAFAYNEVTLPVTVDAAGDYVVRIELDVTAVQGSDDDDVFQVILDDISMELQPPPMVGELVEDVSFEATPAQFGDNPFWEESASSFLPGTVFANNGTFGVELARTGNYFAIMGAGSVATEFVEQTVTVPVPGTFDLKFYFGGGNDRNDDGDDDDGLQGTLRAYVGGEVVYELSAQDAPDYAFAYNEVEVPVTLAAAGDYVVRIELDVTAVQGGDDDDVFQVILDDVMFGTPPPPPMGADMVTAETDVAALGLYADGNVGTDPTTNYTGPGFTFGGENGLFSSVFVAATGPTTVSGTAYDDSGSDWVSVDGIVEVEAPEGFSKAYEVAFTDANAESPLGLLVTLRALVDSTTADANAGFVLEYTIANENDEAIEDLYAGIFADFDVGDFNDNVADFYQSGLVGLNHVWEQSGATNSNYYGVALLNEEASGYSFDYDFDAGDVSTWEGLTDEALPANSPGDRRTTTGAGPYDIAAGESVTVRFAMVAGVDAADIIENAEALALRFFETTLDNGVVALETFGNGYFGAISGDGAGFVFDGANGLYEGQLLVGLSSSNVIGDPYGPDEYEVLNPIRPVAPPAGFQSATMATFASTDGSITVIEETFLPAGFPFAILRYTIKNVSGSAIDGLYAGPFADYDVGTFNTNVGGYDETNRLVYVSDAGDADTDFFGVVSRPENGDVSGWSVTVGTDDAGLYAGLTTPGAADEPQADRRAVIGAGPYALADGERVTVAFALAAAEDLAGLNAAAVIAQTAVLPEVMADAVEPAEELSANEAGLRVFPNPVAGQATIAFRAPVGTDARVTVFDVLGREVLRVADQTATDAEQRVQFSTSSLPAGLYLVRLTAGDTSAVQQITVVR